MNKFIDANEYYNIKDEMHICCDETQFRYVCKECSETMDCYYCGFDPYDSHGCVTL